MWDGFIKTAAVTPKIRVADVSYNAEEVIRLAREADEEGARIIVFPELVLTAYTCGDLFLQAPLIRKAGRALLDVAHRTADLKALIFVGLPVEICGKLYNTAAVLQGGKILGLVPKRSLPNYNEYYEARWFHPGIEAVTEISFFGQTVPFGMNLLFRCMPEEEGLQDAEAGSSGSLADLVVGAELCEDLWTPDPPCTGAAMAGANLIVNLSASVEVTGKNVYREQLVSMTSARLIAGYVYASAGEGESSQDLVFGGQRMICENGTMLANSGRFTCGITYAELDIDRLMAERRRMTTYPSEPSPAYRVVPFTLKMERTVLTRTYNRRPFVPDVQADRERRCEEILTIQALGLKKRIEHVHSKAAVIGISGGLDSTLALLVTARAFDLLSMDHSGILAVTMPAFGTTDRTYHNAVEMSKTLGCTLKEINIKEAVQVHFRDIGHDPSVTDVTYENGQARERTQILMDLANQYGGMVIGTGDMSELALGWATYNGDHMSMYAVNCSVPKTLVRHLVQYVADTCGDQRLQETLLDVLDTPVSPELLPPKDGRIAQITEDLVGPYELHDFFLYYVLRFGFDPLKIYRLAKLAFRGIYEDDVILKWEKTFYWRFFSQQYKRSCIPDGPKVGSVALSPRGDLRMPSDAVVSVWREKLDLL